MHIIGLGCTAQVGKDTGANYLQEKYPGRVKPLSFAYKLKQIAMLLFGLSDEQCNGPKEIKETVDPRYGKTPRQIMQGLGEKMREIYPEIWLDVVFKEAIPKFSAQGFDCFVISDVRYPNEGDVIKENGGIVVEVLRDSGGVLTGKEHSSETAMKDYKFDFIIDNNGTFEEFYDKIGRVVEDMGYGGASRQNNYRRTRTRAFVG